MTVFRPRVWTSLSAAALLLAACNGEGDAEQTQTAAPAAPATVSGEGEGGQGEGEGGGEAGAGAAFAAVPDASRPALQIAQLTGFLLVAEAAQPVQGANAAAALVGQGLAEVYDPGKAAYTEAGVDEALLRKAAETGALADITAARRSLDAAAVKAGGDPAAVVRGMTTVATGLYGEVLKDGIVDPIEYQHSYGAALSARAVADRANLTAAEPELDKLVALWPTPVAPEEPAQLTPAGRLLAQASRVELTLN